MPKRKANSKLHIAYRKLKKEKINNDQPDTIGDKPSWYLFDAKNEILGRLAVKIAKILQGKHKSDFVPYRDMADNVVVINAAKVLLTGKKEKQKLYTFYSGYPSGLKKVNAGEMRKNKPEFLILHAVSGMLPQNKLKKLRLQKLHIFARDDHSFKDKKFIN